MDNHVKVWLRLPREAIRRLHLPSDPNQTNVSRVIETRQSLSKLNHATSYITQVSWIRPSASRGTKSWPSQHLPRDQIRTISTSPEEQNQTILTSAKGPKPNHLDIIIILTKTWPSASSLVYSEWRILDEYLLIFWWSFVDHIDYHKIMWWSFEIIWISSDE